MLSARRSLVRARVTADGTVIAVDRDDSAHARAAGLRAERDPHARLHPAARGAGGPGEQRPGAARLAPLGGTQRIREFLSRNGQPFTYQDVETEPGVQVLLDRFHVGVDEVPVICAGAATCSKPVDRSCCRRRSGLSAELDAGRCATS